MSVELNPLYLQQLRKDINPILSVESNTESMEGFFDTLKNIIPNTIKAFFSFTNSLSFKNSVVKGLDSKWVNVIKKDIIQHPYLDVVDKIAFAPPYYTGTYLQYVELLKEMVAYNNGLIARIEAFDITIGRIISTPTGQLKDFTKEISEYSKWSTGRNTLKNTLASLYTGKSTNDAVPYGNVIKRQADWDEVLKGLVEIEKGINQIDNKKLKKQLDILAEHLAILKEMIEKGSISNPGKDFNKQVAQGTLEMAEQIEFYALMRYQYDILLTCVQRTAEHFK